MKKKTIIALLIAMVMVLGSVQSVFAATGAPTDVTKQDIVAAGVQSAGTITNEVQAEAFAKTLYDQTIKGKYDLIDTATLKSMIDNKEDIVIVDTMPEGWWSKRHIPGAICSVVGANNGPEFKILPEEETALSKAVANAVGKVKVKYYWNSKSKKWVTKKPAKKYWKKCSKKKDKYYGKKTKTVKEVNKNKTIVVYCGFTKCQRSHQGAMYLKKLGYKNVYRYAGGISAWVDAYDGDHSYLIEGSDVE